MCLTLRQPNRLRRRNRSRRAMTFIEVITVMTVMGILFTMAIPSFMRAVEHSHADIAGANLQAIWNAERFYWLENRTYTTDLGELEAQGLLDPSVANGTPRYSFVITVADARNFTARATRVGSTRWSGSFQINETGQVTGVVKASGQPDITPGFN